MARKSRTLTSPVLNHSKPILNSALNDFVGKDADNSDGTENRID
jgi:hypothetical protein